MDFTPVSKARISAIGTYVPEQSLTNADLEKIVETSDEWIIQRTGIKERRIAAKNQYTSDLCIAAVQDLLHCFNKKVEEVDFIIVATTTPDFPFPSVSTQIQKHFSIPSAGAIDISAACAGFSYGLILANSLITCGLYRNILVVAGETLSKVTDYTDRTTCILFGDGAGAVWVERDEENPGFLAASSGTDGTAGIHLYRTGISQHLDHKKLSGEGKIVQNGREVFKIAVHTLTKEIPRLIKKAGLTPEAIDWLIPHSANIRIIQSACERIGFPAEKTLFSAEYFGNTSSATIPLAIDLGIKEGKIKPGDILLLFGFGGGFTHSGVVVKWDCR